MSARYTRRLLVALLLLVVLIALPTGCGRREAPKPPAAGADAAAEPDPAAAPNPQAAPATEPAAQPAKEAAPVKEAEPVQIVTVAPNGLDNAAGTEDWPLSLAGVCAKTDLAPGTRVHLKGGTYKMEKKVEIKWKGEADQRIVMRSAPGEWARLDGAIVVTGGAQYVTLRDFEITRTEDVNIKDPNWWNLPIRTRPSYSGKDANLEFKMGGQLIQVLGSEGVHLINLYVHDNISGGGFGLWNPAVNMLIYGNLMIRNGWEDKGRGHGHGAYIQNGWPEEKLGRSKKVFKHNISALNHSTGSKSYGSAPCIVGTHFFECIHYGAGLLSWTNGSANYLAGCGKNYMDDIVLTGNVFYQPDRITGDVGGGIYLGWGNKDKRTCVFTNNQVYGGGSEAVRAQYWRKLTFTGNTLWDDKRLFSANAGDNDLGGWTWDHNTYHAPEGVEKPIHGPQGAATFDEWKQQSGLDANSKWIAGRPAAVRVTIFPNEYDPNRAHVALANWGKSATPAVDLGGFLKAGDRFMVYDALDYRGEPVGLGEFTGAPVPLTLKDSPVGREFHALVVHRVTPDMKAEYALIEISQKVFAAYRTGDVANALNHLTQAGLADGALAKRIRGVQQLDFQLDAAVKSGDVAAQRTAVDGIVAAEGDPQNAFRTRADALKADFAKQAAEWLAKGLAAQKAGNDVGAAEGFHKALQYAPGTPGAVEGLEGIEKIARRKLNLALNFRHADPAKADALFKELMLLTPPGHRIHERAKEELAGRR